MQRNSWSKWKNLRDRRKRLRSNCARKTAHERMIKQQGDGVRAAYNLGQKGENRFNSDQNAQGLGVTATVRKGAKFQIAYFTKK